MARGQITCVVEVSPGVVDAGANLTLRGRVSCSPACDLSGHAVVIADQTGTEIGTIEVAGPNGPAHDTRELVTTAPLDTGAHVWTAISPATVRHGVEYEQASAPIVFTVKPHDTSVLAWDVPSAIGGGERFAVKVGIKCSSDCRLANGRFEILDHLGAPVAAGTLAGEPWPGTSGLYAAEVQLEAPSAEGSYTWTVRSGDPGTGLPHTEGAATFGVRVVSRPECVVTVEAVERATQAPLEGARVVMHPYKAVTDARGVARIQVPKGAYRLFVSQTRYITFKLPVAVTEDLEARAELDLEPVSERN